MVKIYNIDNMKEVEPIYESSKKTIRLGGSGMEDVKDVRTIKNKSSVLFFIISFFLLIVIFGALSFKFYPNLFSLGGPSPEEVAKRIDEVNKEFISGNPDGAVVVAENMLNRVGGENVDALVTLARAYLEKGNALFQEKEYSEKAMVIIDKIIFLDPDLAEGYRLRGYANEIVGNYDLAIKDYKIAIELYPGFALVYGQIGHVYSLQGDKGEALVFYGKALFLDPGIEVAQMGSAYIYYQDREFDKVIEILTDIEIDLTDTTISSEVKLLRGLVAMEKMNYLQAKSLLEESVKISPTNATAWASLSTAYIALLNMTEEGSESELEYVSAVEKSADKALELHKYNTNAFINKANLKFYNEDCLGATRMYNQALEEFVDKDITLGAIEKNIARTYIQNAISRCEALQKS